MSSSILSLKGFFGALCTEWNGKGNLLDFHIHQLVLINFDQRKSCSTCQAALLTATVVSKTFVFCHKGNTMRMGYAQTFCNYSRSKSSDQLGDWKEQHCLPRCKKHKPLSVSQWGRRSSGGPENTDKSAAPVESSHYDLPKVPLC